jgi:hypothetical protein
VSTVGIKDPRSRNLEPQKQPCVPCSVVSSPCCGSCGPTSWRGLFVSKRGSCKVKSMGRMNGKADNERIFRDGWCNPRRLSLLSRTDDPEMERLLSRPPLFDSVLVASGSCPSNKMCVDINSDIKATTIHRVSGAIGTTDFARYGFTGRPYHYF